MATADVLTTFREDFPEKPNLLDLLNRDRKFEKQFCDATLKAETKCFAVHRVVLGLMSKFFGNLFRTEMKEKFTAVIDIKMTDEQLERLLDCIYTDDVEITTENALEVFQIADYTQIEFLQSKCAKFILQMVDVNNCLEILAYAQRYNLTEIEERAKQVIYGNFSTVVKQDYFAELDFDVMSAIINHETAKNQGESVFTGIIQWVHYKLSSRQQYFDELFSQLDLSTFSGEFLKTTVIDEALVRENKSYCLAVMDVIKPFLPKPQPKNQEILAYAQRYNLTEIEERAKQVIYGNFSDVVMQNDFAELDVDAVSAIINHETAKNQGECVFTGIIQWVHYKLSSRQQYFEELFSQLDLSTFSGEFLKTTVIDEALVRQNKSCCLAVVDVIKPFLPKPQPKNQESTKLLIVGGKGKEKQCVLYDYINKINQELPQPIVPVYGATAVKFMNKVFDFGGYGNNMKSCQMFDLTDRTWTTLADMPEGRCLAACAVLNGLIYVTGGYNNNNRRLSTCIIYDPDNNSWSKGLDLMQPRSGHAMVEFEGSLFVIGGWNGSSRLNSCEKFSDNRWSAIQHMNGARSGVSVAAFQGNIYATCGSNGSKLTTVERYDPRSNSWTQVRPTNVERSFHATCVLQGKLHVICGYDEKSVEVYDPQENKWTVCFHTDDVANQGCIVAV